MTMNMISKLRKNINENGTVTLSIDDFNKLQEEWIKRVPLSREVIQVDSPEGVKP